MKWLLSSRKSLVFALSLAFILAIGIRFYDLTDLPLDYASTRQLFSILKARGMYYALLPANSGQPEWKVEMAIRQWKSMPVIEPEVMEAITALTYRIAGEHLWIARIYSSLFWVFAGIFMFLLAKEIAGKAGAFISVLFYLFLPFGVIASRAFQPDPLMVALIVAGLWATFQWANKQSLRWAVTAGILNGMAIFVKNVAVFPLAFAAIALVFEYGLVKSLKNIQTWILAGLSGLPAAAYTLYGMWAGGFLNQQFAFRFFPQLWSDLTFYLRWKGQIDTVIGFEVFIIALAGVFIAKRRSAAFLTGLWVGYFVYGMTFAYHISTHIYYQLPIIPIAGLSLAPVAETIYTEVKNLRGEFLTRVLLGLSITLVVAIQIWNVRVQLAREDWRSEAEFWSALGDKLGHDSPVLAVAQDYGYRLAYWGWQDVESWYDTADLDLRMLDNRQIDIRQRFEQQAAGKHFLVITQINRLEQQPEIKDFIYNTYPVFDEGKGYIVFDLTKKKQ